VGKRSRLHNPQVADSVNLLGSLGATPCPRLGRCGQALHPMAPWPLRPKVDGLRAETERLRNRKTELIQAGDRALGRAQALEAANQQLQRECREARHRLAVLTAASGSRAQTRASRGGACGDQHLLNQV
jgi:hypothetical protein